MKKLILSLLLLSCAEEPKVLTPEPIPAIDCKTYIDYGEDLDFSYRRFVNKPPDSCNLHGATFHFVFGSAQAFAKFTCLMPLNSARKVEETWSYNHQSYISNDQWEVILPSATFDCEVRIITPDADYAVTQTRVWVVLWNQLNAELPE